MKKEKFLLTALTTLLSISLVMSQNFYTQYLESTIRGTGEAFGSVFGPIFGVSVFSEFLFAKILLFFLLFAIVFMALKRISLFENNNAVHMIVSVIVPILAVRYMGPDEMIRAILLPYGGLGAAITIFLPLIIFFFFLHSSEIGGFGRRAGWFIYGSVFLVLWGSREVSDLGVANWIYILGVGFIIISLIFDKSIHRYFLGWEADQAGMGGKNMARISIKKQMGEVREAWKNGHIGKGEYDSAMKDLKKRYKNI